MVYNSFIFILKKKTRKLCNIYKSLFCVGVIPSSAQGLLLALHSKIMPGRFGEAYMVPEIKPMLAAYEQASSLLYDLSSPNKIY